MTSIPNFSAVQIVLPLLSEEEKMGIKIERIGSHKQ